MRFQIKVALVTGALVMALAPAAMAAGKPEGDPPYGPKGQGNGPVYAPENSPTPGPKAGLPEQAKAYGRYCKGESRKHVKGEKGTAFSRCVVAAAKLRHDEKEDETETETETVS